MREHRNAHIFMGRTPTAVRQGGNLVVEEEVELIGADFAK